MPQVSFYRINSSTSTPSTATGAITFDHYHGTIHVGAGTYYDTYGGLELRQDYSSLKGLTLHPSSNSGNYIWFPPATSTCNGIMSYTDKGNLDKLSYLFGSYTGAYQYSKNYPLYSTTLTRNSTTATIQFNWYNGAEATQFATVAIPAATSSSAGLLSSTHYGKVNALVGNPSLPASSVSFTRSMFTATKTPVYLIVSTWGEDATANYVSTSVVVPAVRSNTGYCWAYGTSTMIFNSNNNVVQATPCLYIASSGNSASISWNGVTASSEVSTKIYKLVS